MRFIVSHPQYVLKDAGGRSLSLIVIEFSTMSFFTIPSHSTWYLCLLVLTTITQNGILKCAQ